MADEKDLVQKPSVSKFVAKPAAKEDVAMTPGLAMMFPAGGMLRPWRDWFDWMDAAFTSVPSAFATAQMEPWSGFSIFDTRADIVENDAGMEITLELPGIAPENVDLSFRGGMLTVRGEKKKEVDRKDKDVRHIERRYGEFRRSFQVPEYIDVEGIAASFDNGILKISLPKQAGAEDTSAKKIPVKAA